MEDHLIQIPNNVAVRLKVEVEFICDWWMQPVDLVKILSAASLRLWPKILFGHKPILIPTWNWSMGKVIWVICSTKWHIFKHLLQKYKIVTTEKIRIFIKDSQPSATYVRPSAVAGRSLFSRVFFFAKSNILSLGNALKKPFQYCWEMCTSIEQRTIFLMLSLCLFAVMRESKRYPILHQPPNSQRPTVVNLENWIQTYWLTNWEICHTCPPSRKIVPTAHIWAPEETHTILLLLGFLIQLQKQKMKICPVVPKMRPKVVEIVTEWQKKITNQNLKNRKLKH